MSSVSWSYPLDQLMVLKGTAKRADDLAPVAEGIVLEHLNFRYEITGDKPLWRPLRAFDDGEKVYVEFPLALLREISRHSSSWAPTKPQNSSIIGSGPPIILSTGFSQPRSCA